MQGIEQGIEQGMEQGRRGAEEEAREQGASNNEPRLNNYDKAMARVASNTTQFY